MSEVLDPLSRRIMQALDLKLGDQYRPSLGISLQYQTGGLAAIAYHDGRWLAWMPSQTPTMYRVPDLRGRGAAEDALRALLRTHTDHECGSAWYCDSSGTWIRGRSSNPAADAIIAPCTGGTRILVYGDPRGAHQGPAMVEDAMAEVDLTLISASAVTSPVRSKVLVY